MKIISIHKQIDRKTGSVLTSPYRPSLNSSLMPCFNPLKPLGDDQHEIPVCVWVSRHRPLALVLLKCWYAQKLIHRLLRVIGLHLLRIVVFVFDSNIARFILVLVFVFKVVTAVVMSVQPWEVTNGEGCALLFARVLHKIVVRHFERSRCVTLERILREIGG